MWRCRGVEHMSAGAVRLPRGRSCHCRYLLSLFISFSAKYMEATLLYCGTYSTRCVVAVLRGDAGIPSSTSEGAIVDGQELSRREAAEQRGPAVGSSSCGVRVPGPTLRLVLPCDEVMSDDGSGAQQVFVQPPATHLPYPA